MRGKSRLVESSGQTPRTDAATLVGFVYHAPGSVPSASPVGCARVFLDGVEVDGYLDSNNKALPRSQRAQVPPNGGFLFANLTPGLHTLRVSFDGGMTFVAEMSFFAPFTRADSLFIYVDHREVVYDVAIDVEAAEEPTDGSCG